VDNKVDVPGGEHRPQVGNHPTGQNTAEGLAVG
jgi:hypothetical protein